MKSGLSDAELGGDTGRRWRHPGAGADGDVGAGASVWDQIGWLDDYLGETKLGAKLGVQDDCGKSQKRGAHVWHMGAHINVIFICVYNWKYAQVGC